MKVCIVGMGHIGTATSDYIMRNATNVKRFQVFPRDKGNIIPPDHDVYVICVPTDQVESVISRFPETDALISVESTVPVGTCRKLMYKDNDIVHCPHRWWNVDTANFGVRQVRVIGGTSSGSLQRGIDFYQSIDVPVFAVDPVELAELSKVAENAYEYLRIAFAQELSRVCKLHNISFPMLRQAMNTNQAWKSVGEVREARKGIQGECLPMAADLLDTFLMKSAKIANQKYMEENGK